MRKIDELYTEDSSRGSWYNIFIERLWWTIKHQYLYLHSFENGLVLRGGLAEWISDYNHVRGHSSLDDRTPDKVYYGLPHPFAQAA